MFKVLEAKTSAIFDRKKVFNNISFRSKKDQDRKDSCFVPVKKVQKIILKVT